MQSGCPFSKNTQYQSNQTLKCPMSGQMSKSIQNGEESQSGCPIIQKRERQDPSIDEHIDQLFSIKYVSKYQEQLDFKSDIQKSRFQQKRVKFELYPFYLQNTIFDEEELIIKNRQQDMMTRFMVSVEMKELANKSFVDKDYRRALQLYQYSLSVLRYLDVQFYIYDSETLDTVEMKLNNLEEKKCQIDSKIQNNINLLRDEKLKQKLLKNYNKKMNNFNKIDEEMKKYLSVFTDLNVQEVRNTEDLQTNDLNLYYSLLLQVLNNTSICLMKMGHFQAARQTIEDSFKIYYENRVHLNTSNQKGSELQENGILLIRSIQSHVFDSSVNYDQLISIQNQVEKCQQLFQSIQFNNLKQKYQEVIGVSNLDQTYVDLIERYHQKVQSRYDYELSIMQDIVQKTKEQVFIDEIIEQKNKLKIVNTDSLILFNMLEDRYLLRVEYFNQIDKKVKQEVIKEFQRFLEVKSLINWLNQININNEVLKQSCFDQKFDLEKNWIHINDQIQIKIDQIFQNCNINRQLLMEQFYDLQNKRDRKMIVNKKKNESKKDLASFLIKQQKYLLSMLLLIVLIFLSFNNDKYLVHWKD